MKNQTKNTLIFIFILIFLISVVIGLKFLADPQKAFIVGSMNGVELSIPEPYEEYSPEYSGETVWKPLKNPPERTYKSSLDSFDLAVKWPSLENKDQNNNKESYRTRRDTDGAKDWVSIEVQSNYENLSPAQIEQQIEYKKTHQKSGITGIAAGQLEPHFFNLPPGNVIKKQGIDSNTGLYFAKLEGPDADKPHLDNQLLYWDGDIEGVVTTFIKCPGGIYVPRLASSKICTQYYDLPELHAEVVVYYHMQLLPDWRQIQDKTRALVLSFKHL